MVHAPVRPAQDNPRLPPSIYFARNFQDTPARIPGCTPEPKEEIVMEYHLTKEEREFLVEGLLRDLRMLRGQLPEAGDPAGQPEGTLSILLLTPMLTRLAGSLEGIVRRCAAVTPGAGTGVARADVPPFPDAPTDVRMLNTSIRTLNKTLRTLVRTIERNSLVDPVTGMANRKRFMEVGQRITSLMLRLERPLSVVSFEVDDLKRINGEIGGQRCEELLLDTVRIVRGSIRQSDAMTRAERNRFCILVPDADEAQARRMAERLRLVMAGAGLLPEEPSVGATLSIGVAAMEPGGQDVGMIFEDTLRRAEKARRGARRGGCNRVQGNMAVQET